MKKLLFLLLLVCSITNAQQTTYSDAEIRAAAGTRWEYLIIGNEMGETNVQFMLNEMGFYPVDEIRKEDTYENQKKKWVHSNQTNGKVVVWEHLKSKLTYAPDGTPYNNITSLDIYGDKASIIKFFVNFWSKALSFRDVKEGETASVRFLSDVATLTVNTDNTAIIKVRSAKDYYKK